MEVGAFSFIIVAAICSRIKKTARCKVRESNLEFDSLMEGDNSCRKVLVATVLKSCFVDHPSEFFLIWEELNTFNQVFIRIPVFGKYVAHFRNQLKSVPVIHFPENWQLDLGHL